MAIIDILFIYYAVGALLVLVAYRSEEWDLALLPLPLFFLALEMGMSRMVPYANNYIPLVPAQGITLCYALFHLIYFAIHRDRAYAHKKAYFLFFMPCALGISGYMLVRVLLIFVSA